MTPSTVAIIGASNDPGKIGGRPVRYLLTCGYTGTILPVNPGRAEIQGLPCFPSIASLPCAPDLAVVALPAHLVVDTVRELADAGARSAVIFSAGFAETGPQGIEQQNALGEIARTSGMRIVGPNCLGIFNANTGMFATFSTSLEQNTPTGGSVAIASQSGAYASHLSMLATERHIPIGYWFSTGNECDIEVAECIHWLADRDDVKVIIAYAEGIRTGDKLRAAFAHAHATKTIVVFVKVGHSEVGSHAAQSHTAALTGSDAVFDSLCRQYGVLRAHNTEEALDAGYAAALGRLPNSRRTGLMTVSGGAGIHMADCADELGLDVAPMPESAQQALQKILPYAGTRNPVDVTAQVINEVALFEDFLELTLDQGQYDIVVIYFTFVAAVDAMIEPMATALKRVLNKYPERLLILSIIAPDAIVARYEATGALVIQDPWRAVRAAAALATLAESLRRPRLPSSRPDPQPLPETSLDEFKAKQLLASHNFQVSRELLVDEPAECIAAGDQLGWPVVVKIVSPDIAHKTEVGGVVTQVQRDDIVAVASTMLGSVREQRPQAEIRGLLVAESIENGVEVIVGIEHDPTFGPVVMFGLGGVFVEVIKDVSFALAPFDEIEANKLIDATQAGPLLSGHRGGAEADRESLVELLLAAGRFADQHRGYVQTMDLNPVIVRTERRGAIALDAVLVARRPDDPLL